MAIPSLSPSIALATPGDLDAIAALLSVVEPQPVTAETLVGRDRTFGPDCVLFRYIAHGEDGRAVGCACISHKPHYEPGLFYVDLVVEPNHRSRGFGAGLLARLEATARENGGTSLRTGVADNAPECRAFAEHRGFEAIGHEFGSEIHIADFDPTPFRDLSGRLAQDGVTFSPLPDLPGDPETNRRELHAINMRLAKDNRPLEQFERDVFGADWFLAEGQILAMHQGRMIGLHALGATAEGELYTMFTGVNEDFRGRGIATALKVAGLSFAASRKIRRVVTDNDAENAPMLRINAKLGFRRLPGSYQLRKRL